MEAVVLLLPEMSPAAEVNVGAWSIACPYDLLSVVVRIVSQLQVGADQVHAAISEAFLGIGGGLSNPNIHKRHRGWRYRRCQRWCGGRQHRCIS
jgi:hypothetical protein